MHPRKVSSILLLLLLLSVPAAGSTFTNFESHQIHPLCMSPDGSRLLAVNTPDNRLTVYSVSLSGLVIIAEIPVGLEPVSVACRNDGEAWVVNHLSDDISIVDLTTMNVRATIDTGDEPTDIVFAGTAGRAFVCVSQEDAVKIYDPVNPAAPPVVVPLFGSDPRALAVSPAGDRVYAAFFESGNRTSVLSEAEVQLGGGAPAPSPPLKAGLPAPPNTGVIIRWTGANWVDETGTKNWNTLVPIPYTLPDNDVARLDANAPVPVPTYFSGVGTLNYNLAVNPNSGDLQVMNFEAFNLVRFEPNLKGRFGQYRVTIIDPVSGSVTPVHLNPHINYAVSPGPPSEVQLSLSQSNGAAWDAAGARLFVAATGSGKLALLNTAGTVTDRIDVGAGPTAVAVDDARGRAYVLNRFTNTVAIVNTVTLTKTGEVGLGYQPEPPAITAGRRFLYDAALTSSHGDLACSSCHPFANFDNIAWDLGDPQGDMQPSPQLGIPAFHPMKGPMTTQTLRGLASTRPFHWRGDRNDFPRFNPAFTALLGAADTLDTPDNQAFNDFIMTVIYPPNPNQNPDRSYPNPPPPTPSPERGRFQFTAVPHDGGLTCQNCHDSNPPLQTHLVAPGTNGILIPGPALQESQAFKIPQLRNMYEKTGFSDAPGPWKRGFGFLHDGSIDNLFRFLLAPVFQFANNQERSDVEAFMHAFDTGTAPAVGLQQTVDALNKNDAAVTARITLLMNQADVGNIDLVVKGIVGGAARGYHYAGSGSFRSDGDNEPLIAESALRGGVTTGAEITYTGVPPGNGSRIGIDPDCDTYGDFHEIQAGSNPADPNSIPGVSAVPTNGGDPAVARLYTPAPNPAGPSGSTISFTAAGAVTVNLDLFDAQGRLVRNLLDGSRQQGTVTLRWDGRDDRGLAVPSGVYFVRMEAAGVVETRRIILAR